MTEVAASSPRIVALTIDCNDLAAMTEFWSALLGVDVRATHEPFAFLTPPEGTGISIWLQQVPEGRAGKTRLHLDLAASDLEGAVHRVEELGGSVGDQHEWQGYVWRQCFDLEGNVFDIMRAPAADPDTD